MITYKDIKRSINLLLTKKFRIEINANDVKEGFIRPSFFVMFDSPTRSGTLTQVEKSLTVRIYYFPTDKNNYSIELLDVQEQLENLFDLKLKVGNRKLNIIEASSTVTDGVLEFSFDLAFIYAKAETSDSPYINDDGEYIEIIEKPVKDDQGNQIVDDQGNPIIVEEEIPIKDENNQPIKVGMMEELEIKKG